MTRRPWWVAPLALALAWLVSSTPAYQRAARALLDAQLNLAWPDGVRDDVAVVDLDDASMRALRAQLGPWPYRRDVIAMVAEFLLELGAKAVVIDLPLTAPRDGDGQLAGTLRHSRRVVLAAQAAGDDAVAHADAPALPPPLGRVLPAHWPRVESASVATPTPALLTAARAVGVAAPLAEAGHLHRLALLHEVQERGLPSLPLAALQALDPDAPLRYAEGRLRLGERSWPLDPQGRVLMKLPSRAAVPTTSFVRVGAAALGITEDGALRRRFAGRTVFVGSSVAAVAKRDALADTTTLAGATSALAAGQVLGAPSRWLDGALIAIALLPAVALWRRERPDSALDTLQPLAAAGAVWMLSTLALAAWGVTSHVAAALAVAAAGWLAALCAARLVRPPPADALAPATDQASMPAAQKRRPARAGLQF